MKESLGRALTDKGIQVSVLLPVHNEYPMIRRHLGGIAQAVRTSCGEDVELILLDNGSTDTTQHVPLGPLSNHPGVRLERVPQKGRGAALKRGFQVARGRYIAILAIDRAWDESFLEVGLNRLEQGLDIVYGSKTQRHSQVQRPWIRKIGSTITMLIVSVLFRAKFTDRQGIKIFRPSQIPFLQDLGAYNYFSETEFHLRAKSHGLRSVEVPVSVQDFRRGSKVRWRSLLEFIGEALHFRRSQNGTHPLSIQKGLSVGVKPTANPGISEFQVPRDTVGLGRI